MSRDAIHVTQTFLPPESEYMAFLQKAWDKRWLTNRGELVNALEEKLKRRFSLPNAIAMANGTLPLQLAIKALGLKGEVITTPFSFIATTSSLLWEGCKPRFVDIDPEYLTIDENLIEAAINEKTSAILATHIYGNPCNIEAIQALAEKYGLKVIYDAAHCFDASYMGRSLFDYGDVSTCSFHATKVFHTGEGGALFTDDEELHERIFRLHKFGFTDQTHFDGIGINAKMSELNAAMGLAVLPYMEETLQSRKAIVERYCNRLDHPSLQLLKLREGTDWNYSYFPIVLPSEKQLLAILDELATAGIYPRRYFYPSLNAAGLTDPEPAPVSESIASRVLCLPLYHGLEEAVVDEIAATMLRQL
jgi:dTDP-4-amino-4,6-dideoxygalactose transaminase